MIKDLRTKLVAWAERVARPLQSRKVRVALATVFAAYAAELGLNVSEEMMLTVVGVGVALILGIAHEDSGARRVEARPPGDAGGVQP